MVGGATICGVVFGPLLVACGSGRGSSGTAMAPPLPVAAAASASATPAAAGANLNGSVVVAGALPAAPVGGAEVRVGTSFAGGSLGGVLASATSAPDGSFSLPVPLVTSLPALPAPIQPPSPYPQIPTPPPGTAATLFIQIDAPAYAPLHRIVYLAPGSVAAGAYGLVVPTADERNALAALNADRARLGAGTGAQPLGLDTDLELTARFVATTMATQGFYAHRYPGTNVAVNVQYCAWPGFCSRYVDGPSENQAANAGTLAAAEAAYIAEGPNGGHEQTIVHPNNLWVGFGAAYGGLCPDGMAGTCSYFVEEFALTAGTP